MDGFVFRSPPTGSPNSGATPTEDRDLLGAMADAAGIIDETQPETMPEPGMSEEEFQGALAVAIADAEEYIDGHIGPMRAKATDYYRGAPFGNEQEGRSSVVMTEVRDAVLGVMPSLLRIFVGGEHSVEFVPQNAESVEIAAQQTDYVDYVFKNDNPGFLILNSLIKDGLTRKTGIVKWRWSTDTTITEERYTGLRAEQVAIMQSDPSVEIVVESVNQPAPAPVDPMSMAMQPGMTGPAPAAMPGLALMGQPGSPPAAPIVPPTYDIRIRRRVPKNRAIVEAIPPEEWLCDRDARDANDESGYRFQAHRSVKTVSDVVAMGYDREEIEQYSTGDAQLRTNIEALARNPAGVGMMPLDTPDASQRECLFYEAYIRVDRDGDGIAELHKVHAIGDAYHVLHDEVVDEAPFAVFCPDPEPHTAIGSSVADQVMDLQRIKSNLFRNTMDSAAQCIHPRTVIVEGQVNTDDAMNTEQGAMVRVRQAGAISELAKPFIGQQMLPLFAMIDDIKAKRTGLSDASQGLSPEVLQSATESAVAATVTGAQERIELYARILAETAIKRMFRGLAKLLRSNQDEPRMIKLRGQFVAVDPRTWIGELECVPNVALGRGTDQQKMQQLMMILAKQEQIIGQLGPVNPIAGVDRYRATLAEIANHAGFKDASKYFGVVTPQFMQQLQQSASNKPPQAADLLAQAEVQKVQNDHQLAMLKFQQEQLEAYQSDQREREKIHLDAIAKLYQTQAQYGSQPNQALIDSILQHQQALSEIQASHVAALHQNMMQAQAQVGSQAVKSLMQAPPQPQQGPAQMPPGLGA